MSWATAILINCYLWAIIKLPLYPIGPFNCCRNPRLPPRQPAEPSDACGNWFLCLLWGGILPCSVGFLDWEMVTGRFELQLTQEVTTIGSGRVSHSHGTFHLLNCSFKVCWCGLWFDHVLSASELGWELPQDGHLWAGAREQAGSHRSVTWVASV